MVSYADKPKHERFSYKNDLDVRVSRSTHDVRHTVNDVRTGRSTFTNELRKSHVIPQGTGVDAIDVYDYYDRLLEQHDLVFSWESKECLVWLLNEKFKSRYSRDLINDWIYTKDDVIIPSLRKQLLARRRARTAEALAADKDKATVFTPRQANGRIG